MHLFRVSFPVFFIFFLVTVRPNRDIIPSHTIIHPARKTNNSNNKSSICNSNANKSANLYSASPSPQNNNDGSNNNSLNNDNNQIFKLRNTSPLKEHKEKKRRRKKILRNNTNPYTQTNRKETQTNTRKHTQKQQ